MELTEKEKMIAGKLYFSGDPELVADRKDARIKLRGINQETDKKKREELVKQTFGRTKNRVYVEPTISFDYGYNIFVGENFYCNFHNVFLDICPITIGDNCLFGPNVQLYTASHPLEPGKRNSGQELGKPITIGNNVWIGGSSVVIPGVTLGDNVVVAAGAVVTKSFPANVVVGGNPAQIIKTIEEESDKDALTQAREKIDHIDREIIALLEKRMSAVSEVTAYKAQTKKAVLDTSREETVLANVADLVKDENYRETIVETFKDIMKQSRKYQEGRLE
ncbi:MULTISPECIES: chorismate mutase [Enterococcus]|uniref:Chorismate mutase n=1 Tax=Enterococcus malodoratus ATCC 43197 TaxID=1158601 RepID=R2NN11_9ENTE|nr:MULTISPECIES: chorismate mutase [Enterococcus]EOH72373.1 chorismate mutase [Enterococcus malodoratus ATCC 43197]EOT70301.1 chorismate mutase [Enterococcus malodoratus ATCC 43197]OJG66504.1 chorismate mutase [Enterococcus malodoratus]SPW69696.1 chorismate mutase [Enterococcus malodoratus]STD65512.1 chorismate mutase [Enterococcus malodoratus]